MGSYGFGVTVAVPPEEAVARITEALKAEGFGVLTEIDVQQTLKQKLGQEMPPYRIWERVIPPWHIRRLSVSQRSACCYPATSSSGQSMGRRG